MKPAGMPLLFCVLAGVLMCQEPTPAAPAKTSTRLAQEIRAALPKFAPPPPTILNQPKDLPADSDVLYLPKVTVKEKRPPGHDPDVWLTDKAVQQKAMAAYKQSMTDLEWALNSWSIPLFGTPPSARARGYYEDRKKMSELRRVHDVFKSISKIEPGAAAALEKERVKMEQTEYWQGRPAGDGRAK